VIQSKRSLSGEQKRQTIEEAESLVLLSPFARLTGAKGLSQLERKIKVEGASM